jgi:hypothetical protein
MRHATPPSFTQPTFFPESVDSHFTAHSLYSSNGGSPDSVVTTNTSPQRSPESTIKSNGPALLPKIRCQDQTTEPSTSIYSANHGRAVSMAVPAIHTAMPYSQIFRRRGTSPLDGCDFQSPSSACSLPASVFSSNLSAVSAGSAMTDITAASFASRFGATPSPMTTQLSSPIANTAELNHGSRRSSLAMVRAVSGPIMPSHQHSRSGSSSSSIDEAALLKHGYPTQYRQMPQYITAAPAVTAAPAISYPVMPIQTPEPFNIISPNDGAGFIAPDIHLNSMAPPTQTTTIMRYLTEPGPRPSLVGRTITDQLKHRDFGWWDIRNLRHWSEFNIDTVLSVRSFPSLLNVPIDLNSLPHPAPLNAAPETEYSLRNIFHEYFSTRINAALEKTQGTHHLTMSALNSATFQHCPKPDFISSYPNDLLKTLKGEPRGHLVGVVKAYEEWNSAMRSQSAPAQVKYLKGLAQLHRIMREHGCRYGFIVTEIELLCVRASAEDDDYAASRRSSANASPHGSDEGPRPIFGYLETAAAIPLSASGANDAATGAPQMTAALALWFLHMLAKDEPLPGQAVWKMDVGGPAAVTRHNHRPRDSWMPRVGMQESRVVKRLRGWVWPEEPFSRKEAPNMKRRGHI